MSRPPSYRAAVLAVLREARDPDGCQARLTASAIVDAVRHARGSANPDRVYDELYKLVDERLVHEWSYPFGPHSPPRYAISVNEEAE